MREISVLPVRAQERPSKVLLENGVLFKLPKSWEVWNAPRPLAGTMTAHGPAIWQGDWKHGVFYAGIVPKDPDANAWRESNASLDGWLLSYITKKEVEAWADRYYGEEMSIDWREMLKDGVATWDDVWKSYFESHTGGWH